jgi:hypothetical protein
VGVYVRYDFKCRYLKYVTHIKNKVPDYSGTLFFIFLTYSVLWVWKCQKKSLEDNFFIYSIFDLI